MLQTITYKGTTPTSFLQASGGSGTFKVGAFANQSSNPATQVSQAVTPPGSGTYTINVASTTGFASSGTLYVVNDKNAVQTITYHGTTPTSFLQCSGGSGTLSVGNLVTQGTGAPFWKLLPDDPANAVIGAYVTGPGIIPGTRIVTRSSQTPNQFLLSAPAVPETNQDYAFNGTAPVLPNLIANASFETPDVSRQPGGYQKQPRSSSWVFGANTGIAADGSDLTKLNPDAPEGTQVGFIQGSGNSLNQTVRLQAGNVYQISFYAAERANDTGTLPVDVLVGQVRGALTLVGTATPASSTYRLYTFYYTPATSGGYVIQFAGHAGAGLDNMAFIDDIQVVSSA